ncbi:MAG: AbrB/MazE/SpoVT family DNA-binding domain-containing protein [Patescibacteria group bacterium]
MTKILQATSQGQVTIPKVWRDKYQTRYFISEISGDTMVIKPLMQDNFADTVEASWKEYKNGMYVTSKELMKKYGL